jgi:molecular chaperone Hsp33
VHDGDILRRFVFERFPVRGHLVHLDASWRALIEHHAYPDAIRTVLGEAVAATVLLAATVKFDGRLTLQVQGPGPMHLLVVQATDRMAVRGVARWRGGLPAGEPGLAALSGDGRMTVTVESEDRQSRYQGVVPLMGDGLAACFEAYFAQSEQLPTRLWLVATGDRAAGLLLQRLPSGASAAAAEVEHSAAAGDEDWNRVLHLAGTLTAAELAGLPADELLRRLFHEEDLRVFDPAPVYFQCRCSRERVSGILRSLGEDEVRDILRERGQVEVRCEFCNRAWQYDAVDVSALFAAAAGTPGPRALH